MMSTGPEDSIVASNLVERKQVIQRRCLVAFSVAITFFYVGAFLGWGPMQLLLEANGNYRSRCALDEAEDVCPKQTSSLLRVQLVANLTFMLSPIFGRIADTKGASMSALCMGISIVMGTFLLTMATEFKVDGLLFPAFICLGIGTGNGFVLTVHTGLYFTGSSRSRVIFTLNSVLDAGGVTYLGLWGIRELTSDAANVSHICAGYLCLAVVLVTGHVYFFFVSVPEDEQERSKVIKSADNVHEESETKRTTGNADVVLEAQQGKIDASACEVDLDHDDSISLYEDGQYSPTVANLENKHNQENAVEIHVSEAYEIIADRPARDQLLSLPFVCVAIFYAIQVTTSHFMIVTARDHLAYLGDDRHHNKYLSIFTLLLPASLVAVPAVDYALMKFGFGGGFIGINLLALGYLLVRLCSDSLNVQIIGFVLFSFYRSFLFGVTLSFLPTFLSIDMIGTSVGLLNLVTAILSFVNIPLAGLAVDQLKGNFFYPTLFYTLLLIPCFIAAEGIRVAIGREHQAKERKARPLERSRHMSLLRIVYAEQIKREIPVKVEDWHHASWSPAAFYANKSLRNLRSHSSHV
jgi:hypothetical protein